MYVYSASHNIYDKVSVSIYNRLYKYDYYVSNILRRNVIQELKGRFRFKFQKFYSLLSCNAYKKVLYFHDYCLYV